MSFDFSRVFFVKRKFRLFCTINEAEKKCYEKTRTQNVNYILYFCYLRCYLYVALSVTLYVEIHNEFKKNTTRLEKEGDRNFLVH